MGGYALAEYGWNAMLLKHVFVVPEDVADKHLRLAGAVQLKVLLWLSRHSGRYDDEACSQAVGASAADCRDALRYWVDAGVLISDEAPQAPATSVQTVQAVQPAAEQTPPKTARPQVVKPQMPEVIARRQSSDEFAYLLDEVSARIGRPLSPGDMETLLYLFDTAGMPAGVLLLVVGYAVSNERASMRYIEKVSLDWADKGIVTITAAEEHLCYLEQTEEALAHITDVCGLEKVPGGAAVRDASVKWVYDWKIADDVLRMAYDVCVQKTGKFQVRYIDRVLENWRDAGADTTEKVAALTGGKSAETAETAEPSEYEDMVNRYIPVYQKKKRKE